MDARLTVFGEPYQTVPFPHARTIQFILLDPNGVKFELSIRNQD